MMDTELDPRYLVGLADIAGLFGVGRSTAATWTRRPAMEMPAPVCRVAMGPLWDLRAVAGWHRNYERLPHGPPVLAGRAPLASGVKAWRDRDTVQHSRT